MALHPDETLLRLGRFLQETSPHAIDLFAASTEDEFVTAVEAILHDAIDKVESKKKREWASYTEPQLRDILVFAIESCGAHATPEEDTNGHVDFTVKHQRESRFRYLGECKVWDGYERHCDGMGQLLRRYASGRRRRTCCLEFVKVPDMAKKFLSLQTDLNSNRPLNQKDASTKHPHIKSAFVTCHLHDSGYEVEVMHCACNVYVDVNAP